MNPEIYFKNNFFKIAASFLVACIIFYYFSYFSVSDLLPSALPLFSDDYNNYSLKLSNYHFSSVRPLSTFIVAALSILGPNFYIWTMRILCILYVWLIWLAFRQFTPKNKKILYVLYFICVFSFPFSVEYARYTGLITSLTSGFFAVAAILFMQNFYKNKSLLFGILGSIFIFLSVLCKEDYLLFYLCFVAFKFMENKKINFLVLLSTISPIIFLLIAKISASSSFMGSNIVSPTDLYYVNINPVSIIITAYKLILVPGTFYQIPGILQLILITCNIILALLLLIRKDTFGLFYLALLISLLLPYSVLPNHISGFYSLIWTPFIYISFFLMLTKLAGDKKHMSLITISTLIALTLITTLINYVPRKSIATGYEISSVKTKNVLDFIVSNKNKINNASCVLVSGVDCLSPWSRVTGAYLRDILHVDSTWYVVPLNNKCDEYFKDSVAPSKGKVSLAATSAPEKYKDCLKLDVSNYYK